ncbi:MAG: hypothetical protein KatS3mg090_1015 [Patescibacteria group bacterium]|nr:MAG: hypothetical protein KatS3mg090_1015 [Patescibacteria group bacterium]
MTNLKQKTRDWLKEKYKAIVGNVEYWNKHSRKSQDLFNLFDLVAIFNHSIYGIQVTSDKNFASHHKKMVQNDILWYWLDTEQFAWLVAWRKKKIKRGGKAYKWTPKIREYYLMDYREVKDLEHSELKINNQVIVWKDLKKS